MAVIDAHHHLWRYTPKEFGWIDEPMAAIRRDFVAADLAAELTHAGVDGSVAVQARQSLEETDWLCAIASEHKAIRGVVGWAPIAAPEFRAVLEELQTRQKLSGLRHVVQAEAPGFLDSDAFNAGIALLKDTRLVYDLLIFERQLEEAIGFVDRHPRQVFVLDHIAKPRIAAGEVEPWRTHLRDLSRRPNVWCKLSGIVTEAAWPQWTYSQISPYLEVALECFGAERLLAGSDWPVCLVACTYADWWATLRTFCAQLSPSEQSAIFGDNAVQAYSLTS
jgi:L-fuconolactonase